ncbi:MAG: hypothetical protein P4L79_01650 [Legionella sp.]|uniref:hypothetical protein n=1 Tax=Legionella sp. TaxID=459 RepID=UPI002845B3C1|nr:hypothetical protein [Legionella sp.]
MPKNVWVYSGTSTTYKGDVDVQQLQQTKLNPKTNLIEQGTLFVGENQAVALELITQDTQRRRADKVWVYSGTSIAYKEAFDVQQLQQIKLNPKAGFIEQGTLFVGENQAVAVELITRATQRQRAEIWVYLGTGIAYEENLNVQQLQQPQVNPKTGLIEQGTIFVGENQTVALELITRAAQKQRAANVWVYLGTSIAYKEAFDVQQLQQIKLNPKTGFIEQGTLFIGENQAATLELITRNAKKLRAANVWVYLGTGITYEGSVDALQLQQIKLNPKTGLIEQGTLFVGENQPVILELITCATQRRRAANVWVYLGTGIAYKEAFDLQQLQHTKVNPTTGFIEQGALLVGENQTVVLEFITRSTQRQRAEIWVYLGTGIAYEGNLNVLQLQQIKLNPKTGLIEQGTLFVGENQTVTLERITQDTQRVRATNVWVYLETGIVYKGRVDVLQLQQIQLNPKTGLIEQGTLFVGENQGVTLEFITQATQRKRAKRQNRHTEERLFDEDLSSAFTPLQKQKTRETSDDNIGHSMRLTFFGDYRVPDGVTGSRTQDDARILGKSQI